MKEQKRTLTPEQVLALAEHVETQSCRRTTSTRSPTTTRR